MSSVTPNTSREWDRFLTTQDRAHLELLEDRRVGFGCRPALIMIDLYRDAFGDQPVPLLEGVKTWPDYCGMAAWNAIPHLQKLLAEARHAAIPVLHVTGLNAMGLPSWGEATHRSPERKYNYAIMPQVSPVDGEVVLRKSSPSVFWGTPLVGHLTYLGVDTILVAGETTSGCVRASVVDGCTYRYRMQVVEECVFDRHEASHAISLFDMHRKYADVISLDDAVAYLRSLTKVNEK